jgi:hypothetical protein
MDVLNRTLVTLIPQLPFLAWVKALGDDCAAISESDLLEDCNAYLVPELESEEDLEEFFELSYERFFEAELADWVEEEAKWPELRDYLAFQKFFDVQVQTVVYDMVNEPIEKDPY